MNRNRSCTDCPLHASAANVCIPTSAVGQPSRVLVLGQSPGPQEDQADEPFLATAPSGGLLKRKLDKAGGLPGYWKGNAVRCFVPPGDKIDGTWIKACHQYLDADLAEIQPTHILALGNEAMYSIMGHRVKITEVAGKEMWVPKLNAWVMPAEHPAAILRNPNKESAWELDIARFVKLVKHKLFTTNEPPARAHLVETERQLDVLISTLNIAALDPSTVLTYDFETTDAEKRPWWHDDFLGLSVAFSTNGYDAWVLPLWHKDSPFSEHQIERFFDETRDVMTTAAIERVPWNGMFDDLCWNRMAMGRDTFVTGYGYLPNPTFDGMLANHVLDENQPKGLKWNGRAKLGWPDWGVDTRDLQDKPLDFFWRYNGYDAVATWLLRAQQVVELRGYPDLERYFLRLTMPELRRSERQVARGIYLEEGEVLPRLHVAQQNRATAAAQLPIDNPGAPAQVGEWLYKRLNLPILKRTPTGGASTDEETLNRLAQKYPEIRQVKEWRKWDRNMSHYLLPPLDALKHSIDGRLHPNIRKEGTETGRDASAYHTIPRDTFIRSMYTAPPGFALVAPDYMQLEPRIAAWRAAGCPRTWDEVPGTAHMLLAFRDGVDIYVETAAAILNKRPTDITRDHRDGNNERQIMGKVPALAMIYSISARGFREYAWKEFELDLTENQAQHMWRMFYARWPEIKAWHEREGRILRGRGWTKTALGRMRRLPGAQSTNRFVSEESIRQGINAPVQGLGNEVTKAAGLVVERAMPTDVGYSVLDVHDQILFYIRDEYVEEWVPKIEWLMSQTPQLLQPMGLEIPPGLLRVEVLIGPWGEGVDLETWKAQRGVLV